MNIATATTTVEYLVNHQEWAIGIVSAIIGSILTLITTIVWDNHKNKRKYRAFLKLLLSELRENKKRVNSTIEQLPQDIIERIEKGNINIDKVVFIPEEEISKMGWSFPKPYTTDAWKTFISSGFAVELPAKLFKEIYKIYDSINSINFLSNLSVSIFQILSQQNKLDEQTNKNFDQFCKFGTRSLEVMLSKDINQAVDNLARVVN